MAKLTISTKRLQISRANATMIGIIAGASFLVIFALIASQALLKQRSFQEKVIKEKTIAKRQLDDNVKEAEKLRAAYQEFISAPENVLGGNPNGKGDKDGDNAKIVLDALPSKYDFPALTTSLEKILNDKTYKIEDISGSDDEINQKNNASSPSPIAVDIPFEITVSGSYPALQNLISSLERSIRPFHILTMDVSGSDANARVEIKAKTYYQPEKSLKINMKEVR